MNEAIALAKRSDKLPQEIKNITAENGNFKISVPNPIPLLPTININIAYSKFENDKIYFTIAGGKMVDLLGALIKNKNLKGITIDYPDLIIDVNELLPEEYDDIIVNDVQFDGDEFTIETKLLNIPNLS